MNYKRMTSEDFPDWFAELLLLRATDGLDESQQRMFDQFVEEHADPQNIEAEAEKLELAVAAIDLNYQSSESEDENPLPEGLRRKVLDGARKHFESSPAATVTPATEMVGARAESARSGGLTSREALAWLAAAAAVTVLLTGWNPFGGPSPSSSGTEIVAGLSIEEKFEDFVTGEEADLVRVAWKATGESLATGEVVWRDSSQRGFMVFEGLAANNPLQSQYQLWIFDTDAEQEHPVDGGVFNVSPGERNIVPIDARIPIEKAVMFAVTEERPGGVVVSDRSQLPLLAVVKPPNVVSTPGSFDTGRGGAQLSE